MLRWGLTKTHYINYQSAAHAAKVTEQPHRTTLIKMGFGTTLCMRAF
jgi:hypothetical protein